MNIMTKLVRSIMLNISIQNIRKMDLTIAQMMDSSV